VTLAACFVVHAGELEAKALLLAASLRRYWPREVELIACLPGDSNQEDISAACREALGALGVRFSRTSNPIGADYPIGNKLLCLDTDTAADCILFLDSDIIALLPANHEDLAAAFGGGFAAKPADLATFNAEIARWASIYKACGAVMPNLTVTATISGDKMPPYFNAGVIAVGANSGFGLLWSQCAKLIDSLPELSGKRPHLDQIALPIAASKSGEKINLLGEEWNFPAHLRPLPPILPKLCHYHWPEVMSREPALLDSLEDLVATTPRLAGILEQNEKWHGISRRIRGKRTTQRAKKLPEGIITGIPRSGTSYLCQLLHKLPDHVVINEPSDIFSLLKRPAPGPRLACYYRDLRRRILDGESVENKTEGGEIIADTAKMDVRTKAPIAVGRDDFTLWTKNTLAYINRLPQLLDAMPEATFVACVRHPVDTIASWTRTFPHLRDADVARFPVGYPTDPFLSPAQREQLTAIAACSDLPRRRALLWNYLAEVIIKHQNRVTIVRLEELANCPETTLCNLDRPFYRTTGGGIDTRCGLEAKAATPDHLIASICAPLAAELGYLLTDR
jgi:hypothetical protein